MLQNLSKVKMDAALLAEREAFKRRAMAVPTIENKKRPKVKLETEFNNHINLTIDKINQ